MDRIIFAFCILAASLRFAQAQDTLPSFSESSAPAEAAPIPFVPFAEEPAAEPPPPAPVPEAPAPAVPAPGGKTVFDALRGHAYNPFSITGAATSVTDLVATPNDIYGQKFIYISPDNLGFAAFGLDGSSLLIGLQNSDNLGALILGYATSSFGVALDYSIGKAWEKNEPGNNVTISQRTTSPGDNIGLYFSLSNGLYANLGWRTYESYSTKIEGYSDKNSNGEFSVDNSRLSAEAGMLGNSGALNYDIYLDAWRIGASATNTIIAQGGKDGDKAVDLNTYLGLSFNFNIGYVILPNEITKVIIGSNNRVGVRLYDKIEGIAKSGSVINAQIMPNILGEIALSENLLTFAGAAQSLNLIAGEGASLRNDDISRLEIMQNPTQTFFVGMRYQKVNWALEMQVSDNPFAAFAGNQILTQLGGFIYF